MATAFAALEARTARAVLGHLSNAQAQATTRFGEVVSFPVIFDAAYTGAASNIFEASRPQCIAQSAHVQDLLQGSHIDIPETVPGAGATCWQAVEIQPDGTGITLIILERVTP